MAGQAIVMGDPAMFAVTKCLLHSSLNIMLGVLGIVLSVVPLIGLPCCECKNPKLDVVVIEPVGVDAAYM